ncbi:hypothetical protein [Actinosynnema pretiosum]|uniref:Uncharacterized protein n=2 Tax=Actinosynnema TaxID=40566 RepID=A0A290Z341_9PSEU|nr:hypothetical protein [Actinosynnema pretiosum]ATE53417.1 hypothetical protein CNX65_09020 [Actinosynnema pretiosum]
MRNFPLALAETRFGMPAENARKFQQVAAQQNLVIDVRATNQHAVPWLRAGALPKPEAIKAKTIDERDVRLGARPRHLGLVGFFDPIEPRRDRSEAVLKRFAMRRAEYDALGPKMAVLAERGEYFVRDGVVHGHDREGRVQPVTGDHDVFDIRGAGGGEISDERYWRAVDTMMSLDMGVTHGAHMMWKPVTEGDRAIFESIARDGSPKLRFHPDGSLSSGDFRPVGSTGYRPDHLPLGASAITRPEGAARPHVALAGVGSWRGEVHEPVSALSSLP